MPPQGGLRGTSLARSGCPDDPIRISDPGVFKENESIYRRAKEVKELNRR